MIEITITITNDNEGNFTCDRCSYIPKDGQVFFIDKDGNGLCEDCVSWDLDEPDFDEREYEC